MYFRLMAAIFDLPVTLTSEISHVSPSVLLNPDNVGLAVGISLLSGAQAEIFVIAYVLPLNDVTCRTFLDITLELHHPIHIRFDGRHFDFFVGVAWNIVQLETSERKRLCSATDQ